MLSNVPLGAEVGIGHTHVVQRFVGITALLVLIAQRGIGRQLMIKPDGGIQSPNGTNAPRYRPRGGDVLPKACHARGKTAPIQTHAQCSGEPLIKRAIAGRSIGAPSGQPQHDLLIMEPKPVALIKALEGVVRVTGIIGPPRPQATSTARHRYDFQRAR